MFSLLLLARNLIIDGEAAYLAQAVDMEKIWETLPGTKGAEYPIILSQAEKQMITEDMEAAALGMDVMRAMRESLGDLFSIQGWVPEGDYEEAVDALSQMREQVIANFATNDEESETWRAQWPFSGLDG